MSSGVSRTQIALAVAAALGAAALVAVSNAGSAGKKEGRYAAGDFHNHTTCSDGSISMQKLVKKSTDKEDTPWGLDWFVQAGHGGNGNRNCTLVEDATLGTPAYPFRLRTGPNHHLGQQHRRGSREGQRGPELRRRPEQHGPEQPGQSQHVALAVGPGVPVPAARVPVRVAGPAALYRPGISRRGTRARLDVGNYGADARWSAKGQTAEFASLPARCPGQRHGARPMVVLLRPG